MNANLYVEAIGQGEPIVLIHGGFDPAEETFSEQKELADEYRVVLVDRRGYGKSPPAERLDFAAQVEDIAGVIADGAHLVGHCLQPCSGKAVLDFSEGGLYLALTLLSGVAWTVVYVEAIRIGFRQQTYAIPAVALALNFAWESIYTIRGLAIDLSVQAFVTLAWALADALIVYTFLRYGRRELPPFVNRLMFLGWSALIFATAYLIQWLFIVEFGWAAAPKYAAFLQNLLMSGLFIAMFVGRQGARGQSIVIAAAKWIGTLAPTIVFGVLAGSAFILGIGILCSVFDLIYLGLLIWARGIPAQFGAATEPSRSEADSRHRNGVAASG